MVKYDGHLVLVGRSTSQMTKAVFADLLTYVLSEMAKREIELPPRPAESIAEYISRYGNARA
jgi:hypothetical protein